MKEKVIVALGVFDGVHRGHQKIIKALKDLALQNDSSPLVAAFEPNPLEILAPSKAPKRLTSFDERAVLLKSLDGIFVDKFAFTEEIAHMDGKAFWSYLKQRYHLCGVVVGFNFHFGSGAKWDGGDLKRMADDDRLTCKIVDAYLVDGAPVSSTRIRSLLSKGQITQANKLLGRTYHVKGTVGFGKQLGRTIDFPTANIEIAPEMQKPMPGVYITRTKIKDNWYPSMTNIGKNPTVKGTQRTKIETHILDVMDDLYEEVIKIEFHKRLRDEIDFGTMDALQNQLRKDRNSVVAYYKTNNM